MDPKLLDKKAAVQRQHAIERARERYGLYIDNSLYDDIRALCWRGIQERTSKVKVLGRQEKHVWVLKLWFLQEWVLLIFDSETQQIRTFLPPSSRYVRSMNVEAA